MGQFVLNFPATVYNIHDPCPSTLLIASNEKELITPEDGLLLCLWLFCVGVLL